jgi:hypothetical protein
MHRHQNLRVSVENVADPFVLLPKFAYCLGKVFVTAVEREGQHRFSNLTHPCPPWGTDVDTTIPKG